MCELYSCIGGTTFLVYTEGKRAFGIETCPQHVSLAIAKINDRNREAGRSTEKIIVEPVN